MADGKETKLSIVIRTVDQATAKINAINARLDAVTKPIRNFKEALGDLRSKSGLDDMIGGFKGVGSAIGDLLAKVAMIGGVVGLGVAAVFHLVGQFDELGDKAERFGVSVDFLAQMRYAAEKAGAPVGALDDGMSAFSVSLGKARAGTGRMLAFLNKVSPALATQLKGAKSNEEAFDLLAGAMAKIEDPAKRAALATATVGSDALAPLFHAGAKGVKELRDRYLEFAGSQQDAADKAGKVDDSLHDLHAATDGLKAGIVAGLSPALKTLVDNLAVWFKENRTRVAEFAAELGTRLPGAVSTLIGVVHDIVDAITPFVDSTTKLKIIGIALAGVLAGPLISAIVTLGIALATTPVGWLVAGLAALTVLAVKLGVPLAGLAVGIAGVGLAMMGNPFGLWLTGIAALGVAIYELVKHIEWVKEKLDSLLGSGLAMEAKAVLEAHDKAAVPDLSFDPERTSSTIADMRAQHQQAQSAPQPAGAAPPQQSVKVEVEVKGPKDTRVKTQQSGDNIDVTTGLQMWGLS